MVCTPHPVFFGNQIEKNDVVGACSKHGKSRDIYRVLVGKGNGV